MSGMGWDGMTLPLFSLSLERKNQRNNQPLPSHLVPLGSFVSWWVWFLNQTGIVHLVCLAAVSYKHFVHLDFACFVGRCGPVSSPRFLKLPRRTYLRTMFVCANLHVKLPRFLRAGRLHGADFDCREGVDGHLQAQPAGRCGDR